MKSQISLAYSLFSPLSNLHLRTKRSLPRLKPPPSLTFLRGNSRHFHLPGLPSQNSTPMVVEAVTLDGPLIEIGELSGIDDGDVLFETCITRNLPPALTLEHGLQRIKEAVETMKMDPPSSASGIFRFQVAVPPSPKALNWFCCQPESSVYPLFFLSKDTDNPTYKSLYLRESRGVFGIGAAIYFMNSSSSSSTTSGGRGSTKRYLSINSTSTMAYGFVEINFNKVSSCMMHEAGSSYFFIPQIELDEHEGFSILAATLAWSDSSFCSFEDAVCSYELSLKQASSHSWPNKDICGSKSISSTLRKLNLVEDKTVTMVFSFSFID